MRTRRTTGVALALAAAALAVPAPAQAAKRCGEPGDRWPRATPAEAGMDAAKLRAAIDWGSTQQSFAVRVYRRGCLVGEDRLNPEGSSAKFESWSMAKSVTALVFGRAMRKELTSPHDPTGALVTEADHAHGNVTMRHLLEMTSGFAWNGFRDYNIFMRDRLRDALTVGFAHDPGTYYEYSQSGVALLAAATQRAVGEDFQSFAQRELFGPLGIAPGAWHWRRDQVGNTQGFFGLNMRADDFARFGELMRRRGSWKGRQLLSRRFMRRATKPTKNNGCYGWLIWLNRTRPCVRPRVQDREVVNAREFPELPRDMYHFAGLFGQLVTIFPTQDLMVVRTGQDPNPGGFAGGASWENELYKRVLASVADQRIVPPGDDSGPPLGDSSKDPGFQDSILHPEQYVLGGGLQPPLPPAGPQRARAPLLFAARWRAGRTGRVLIRVKCPARWPGRAPQRCRGPAKLEGARRTLHYDIGPGTSARLAFRLKRRVFRRLRRRRELTLTMSARNRDAASGTLASEPLDVARPATAPRVRIRSRRLRLGRGGRVRVRLACPRRAKRRCKGRLRLRRRGRTIGSRRFNIRPGRRAVRRVRLRRGARRLVRRRGRVRALAVARTTVPDGFSRTSRRRVRIAR